MAERSGDQRSGGNNARASGKPNGAASAQDTNAQTAECEELEEQLARLRAAWDQYFMGVERHPPTTQHTAFKQRLEHLKQAFIRNSVVKFRVGNLAQKAGTYERLWSRTLSEMENGTYRRDLFKARRKQKARVTADSDATEAKTDAATADSITEALSSGSPGPVAPPIPRASPAPGQLSDARVRAIYDAYVEAKRRCNEDTSKITFESLAVTLRKQVPDLLKRHQAQAVDFKVVIKDGKAVLRAVPK
jgi:hypothetical protein